MCCTTQLIWYQWSFKELISHLANTVEEKTEPWDFPDIELLFQNESEIQTAAE